MRSVMLVFFANVVLPYVPVLPFLFRWHLLIPHDLVTTLDAHLVHCPSHGFFVTCMPTHDLLKFVQFHIILVYTWNFGVSLRFYFIFNHTLLWVLLSSYIYPIGVQAPSLMLMSDLFIFFHLVGPVMPPPGAQRPTIWDGRPVFCSIAGYRPCPTPLCIAPFPCICCYHCAPVGYGCMASFHPRVGERRVLAALGIYMWPLGTAMIWSDWPLISHKLTASHQASSHLWWCGATWWSNKTTWSRLEQQRDVTTSETAARRMRWRPYTVKSSLFARCRRCCCFRGLYTGGDPRDA